ISSSVSWGNRWLRQSRRGLTWKGISRANELRGRLEGRHSYLLVLSAGSPVHWIRHPFYGRANRRGKSISYGQTPDRSCQVQVSLLYDKLISLSSMKEPTAWSDH